MQADVVNGFIIVCFELRKNTISNTRLHKSAMALRLGLIPMSRPMSTPRDGKNVVSCVCVRVIVVIQIVYHGNGD